MEQRRKVSYLPVLVEPVVGLGLGVEGIAEVARARRRDPVHGAVVQQEVVDQLLVAALVVLLHDSEVTVRRGSHYIHKMAWSVNSLLKAPSGSLVAQKATCPCS